MHIFLGTAGIVSLSVSGGRVYKWLYIVGTHSITCQFIGSKVRKAVNSSINATTGSLMRLSIRFVRKSLPLVLICIAFLLTVRIWRVWNDINVINMNFPTGTGSSSVERSYALTAGQSSRFNSLTSNYTTRQPILQHHIHRTKLLSTVICPNTLFLLILVSTNVGNVDRRHIIRKTWGADYSLKTKWKTVFLLGKNSNEQEMQISKKEAEIYGDMVQADYYEHFWNMSYKVAMGFEWSVKYCSYSYLLKSDDDVFVNTFGMMDFLSKYTTPRHKFYTGNIMVGSVVMRDGRYAVSPEEYNETVYKPYCSGGGYVLSRDVVEQFLSYFDVYKPLKIDDAYIGILADQAGVKVTNNKEFRMYETKCEYRESTLVQHPARGDCAIKLYNSMIKSVLG